MNKLATSFDDGFCRQPWMWTVAGESFLFVTIGLSIFDYIVKRKRKKKRVDLGWWKIYTSYIFIYTFCFLDRRHQSVQCLHVFLSRGGVSWLYFFCQKAAVSFVFSRFCFLLLLTIFLWTRRSRDDKETVHLFFRLEGFSGPAGEAPITGNTPSFVIVSQFRRRIFWYHGGT